MECRLVSKYLRGSYKKTAITVECARLVTIGSRSQGPKQTTKRYAMLVIRSETSDPD